MMKQARRLLLALLALFPVLPLMAGEPVVIGWVEDVSVVPHNLTFHAKIDTGADNSSMHAEDIHIYEKANAKRVRFTVEDDRGEVTKLDMPLLRITNIKRKGADDQYRPVVSMKLCLGKQMREVEVNLANRANFEYHMLIGRSFLKGLYAVDSARQYTTKPTCAK